MITSGITSSLSPDELYMICSYGGRILLVSAPLAEFIGADLVGKNLNDVIEDRIVSRLIKNVDRENIYEFDCVLNSRAFSCGAKLSPDESIVMMLSPNAPRSQQDAGPRLIRYIGREINANIDNISIAYSALRKSAADLPPAASGLIEKSLLNLTRISKNAVTKVDYEEGVFSVEPRRGDLARDVTEVCGSAAAFCRGYAEIFFEGLNEPLECSYDPTAIKRMMLNLISYSISSAPAKYPRISVRMSRRDDAAIITISCAGASSGSAADHDGRADTPDLELEIASILARKHRGSIISTQRRDGGQALRVTLPLISESPSQELSSFMIDWYGGMDMVSVELSGVMPPEAYVKR